MYNICSALCSSRDSIRFWTHYQEIEAIFRLIKISRNNEHGGYMNISDKTGCISKKYLCQPKKCHFTSKRDISRSKLKYLRWINFFHCIQSAYIYCIIVLVLLQSVGVVIFLKKYDENRASDETRKVGGGANLFHEYINLPQHRGLIKAQNRGSIKWM